MNEVGLVRLPRAFFDDHAARELPTPAVVRENTRFVYVRRDDQSLVELVEDARYYADPEGFDEETRRVVKAAQRLLVALREQGMDAWME